MYLRPIIYAHDWVTWLAGAIGAALLYIPLHGIWTSQGTWKDKCILTAAMILILLLWRAPGNDVICWADGCW